MIKLESVTYPNGLRKEFTNQSAVSQPESLGYAGYQTYAFTNNLCTCYYDSAEEQSIYLKNKKYYFGDYSSVLPSTVKTRTYGTKAYESQYKFIPGVGSLGWYTQKTSYRFDHNSHYKTLEKMYIYPEIQPCRITSSSVLDDLINDPNFNGGLIKQTEYEYNNDGLPTSISNTYYNSGSSTAGMTEDYAYTYDAKGNVLTERKPNSLRVTYTYDSTYSLPLTQWYYQDANTQIYKMNTLTADGKNIGTQTVKSNNVLKSQTVYVYNTDGSLATEKDYTDASNYVEKAYVYVDASQDTTAQPTEISVNGVKDADGNLVPGTTGYDSGVIVQKYGYNDRGWIVSQTDAEGNETEIAYDGTGRITQVTNPDGTYATYVYNVANNTVTYTNEIGYAVQYQYDYTGSLTGVYDVAGQQLLSSKTYGSTGNLIAETVYSSGGEDLNKYYYYDNSNRIIETGTKDESDNLTSQETYTYEYTDGNYKTTKTVTGDTYSPSIVTTSYVNNMGYTVKTGRMLGGTEYVDTYTYDKMGNKLTEKTAYTTSLGGTNTNSYTYDYAGNVLSVANALEETTNNTYNWLGNQLTAEDHSGNTTEYKYDALGRLLETQTPFCAESGTTYYTVTKYTYDRNGNVISQKTANNAPGTTTTWSQTDYSYNSRGNLVKVTTYDGGAAENYTQYYYDAVGNTLRMYTGLSSPLTISGLDTVSGSDTAYSVTRYHYNRFSQLDVMTDPLSQTEEYVYDINGSPLTKTDRNGNETTYAYDDLGQVLSVDVETPDGEGDSSVAYTYTLTGLKRSESNESGMTLYTYDALGRLTGETDSGTSTAKAYTYDIGGNRATFTLTVGGVQERNTTYVYDVLSRLTYLAEDLKTVAYVYDANGNRDYMVYNNGLREEYEYNLANLVTDVTNKNSGGTALSQYTYTYTLDGNQVSKNDNAGTIKTYAYDGLGRLETETETVNSVQTQSYAYAYDDSNNRATLIAAGTDAYATVYDYDLNNRLTTETKTSSGSEDTTTFYYDPNGNQTAKTMESLTDASGTEELGLTNGVVSSQLSSYNGLNQLVETQLDGTAVTYTYDPSGLRLSKTVNGTQTNYILDGANVALETVGGTITASYVFGVNLVSSDIGGTDYYYLFNAHGDVVQLTDSTGVVTKSYDYDAFGNEKNAVESDVNPFRYCGEYYDLETKTYYLRARNYDPTTGRFLSEDPAQSGLNWYAYCGNNPILYVDPSGLESYVFYTTAKNSDFTKQAEWQKERLEGMGETVIMIEVTSVDDFMNGWNGMGTVDGDTVDINTVVIYTHGNQRSMIFESGSSTNGMSVNGKNLAGGDIGNINDLESKEIGELHLLSCNAGNILTYYNEGENLASVLSKKVVNGNTYAYDGNVSFGKPAWDIFGDDIGMSSRLATNQHGFWEIAGKYNSNVKPRGKVTYYNGEYKPYGYWPNTFISAAS